MDHRLGYSIGYFARGAPESHFDFRHYFSVKSAQTQTSPVICSISLMDLPTAPSSAATSTNFNSLPAINSPFNSSMFVDNSSNSFDLRDDDFISLAMNNMHLAEKTESFAGGNYSKELSNTTSSPIANSSPHAPASIENDNWNGDDTVMDLADNSSNNGDPIPLPKTVPAKTRSHTQSEPAAVNRVRMSQGSTQQSLTGMLVDAKRTLLDISESTGKFVETKDFISFCVSAITLNMRLMLSLKSDDSLDADT